VGGGEAGLYVVGVVVRGCAEWLGGGILGAAVATVCGMFGPIRTLVEFRDVAGNWDVAG
jgi:hypothetical protein